MASLASETDIYNLALDLLDEEPILSAGVDNRKAVRFMRRHYALTRDALLELHPWKFAIARAALASGADPLFGWGYSYALPNDCLRLIPLTTGGDENGRPIPFRLEGDGILCDQEGPLYIRYIKRVTVTTKFSNLFVQALTTALAAKAAANITGKKSYRDTLLSEYRDAIVQAQIVDSVQTTPDEPVTDAWIDGRYGT